MAIRLRFCFEAYKDSIIPPDVVARVAVEKASTLGWRRYTGLRGHIIGMVIVVLRTGRTG